jgi:hypothetical protein
MRFLDLKVSLGLASRICAVGFLAVLAGGCGRQLEVLAPQARVVAGAARRRGKARVGSRVNRSVK